MKTRLFTLLCYSMYALSPLYAALPASHRAQGMEGPSCRHVEFGILWLNLAIDSFVDGDGADIRACGDRRLQATPSDDLVLIKKKRAVTNRHDLPRPQFALAAAISEQEPLLPVASLFDICRDFIHQHADGCYSLGAGLSPPSLLS